MNNAYQITSRDTEPLDDRLDTFFKELELAVKWQRPSILLAVYPSEDVHAETEAALENKVIDFGQKVVHIRGEDDQNLDLSLFISRIPDADKVIFFIDGLSRGSKRDGFNIYQALNVSREYFVEKQIRIVFWLTEAEAVSLAHFAPDFWASRHRVIDFIESQKPDETLIRVSESAWQGQGEYKHMNDNLVDTHAKISLRETTQAGLPEWDGSTTAGVNLLLTLGIMHWRKGDHDKANESLQSALDIAIKTQDKRLEAVCFNAIALVKTDLGMLDEAVEAYEQAIERAPEKTFIWGHLGNLYSKLGLHEEALEAFLNTLEHNPVDSTVWNSLGNAYVNTGRADEAIDAYRKAAELNDRFIDPWMSLGALFKKQNLSGDAIKAYQQATRIDSNNAQAWNELGNIYFELEAFDEAIEAYNIAIKSGFEAGWSYCNLASAYAHKDEFASAIPFYYKSVELFGTDGDKAIAWNLLGDVYRQVKDYDNAISAYQRADKLVEADGSSSTSQLSYLNSLIVRERIVNELSTDLLEQVREMVAAEDAAPDNNEPIQAEAMAEKIAVGDQAESVEEVIAAEDAIPANNELIQSEAVAEEIAVGDQAESAEQTLEPVEETAAVEQVSEIIDTSTPEIDQPVDNNDELIQDVTVAGEADEETVATALESFVAEMTPPDALDQADETVPAEEPAQRVVITSSGVLEPVSAAAPPPTDDEDVKQSETPVVEETAQETVSLELETVDLPVAAEVAPSVAKQETTPEIDLRNSHIWNELGNIYFKVGAYDEALEAYNKAIALGLEFGLLYSNLGFACAHKGKFAEAIPLYEKSIELLASDEDKALSWGRLGDAYRQVSEFAKAISAYGKALELDPPNASFNENLNEMCEKLAQLDAATEVVEESHGNTNLQVEQVEQPVISVPESQAEVEDDTLIIKEEESDDAIVAGVVSRLFEEDTVPEILSIASPLGADSNSTQPTESTPVEEASTSVVETISEVVSPDAEQSAQNPDIDEINTAQMQDVGVMENQQLIEANISIASATAGETATIENSASLDSMRKIDLKNAHIWNELGNIFVKANSFDDAIDAYNKAIELEPEFGWPYSNLGLVYAQKGHFGETISLYQRSIELFSGNKDKAISWNRLGDAYRQLNEYDNAIAAYQIADELNQNENVSQNNVREVNLSQVSPIFSYLNGGSNDRF